MLCAIVPAKTHLLPATNNRKTPCGTSITQGDATKEMQHHK